ncbi:hypothetical protein IHE45_15G057100 [Dioscorea alata]|uniref:Uncharacterized protein n=1 Tax=Dioscorea alata TaxID=55571 RepID=A0ACB7ULT1_DIOAL|nr:hypothetical protein IHE45_15G057100 [Dioscorea alata]
MPEEINDDHWIKTVIVELNKCRPRIQFQKRCTIFKVPEDIQKCDKKGAYDPVLIAIGHYHHGLSKDSMTRADNKWIPTASELQLVGIKFEENKEAKSFLNISFKNNGTREIPQLSLDDFIILASHRHNFGTPMVFNLDIIPSFFSCLQPNNSTKNSFLQSLLNHRQSLNIILGTFHLLNFSTFRQRTFFNYFPQILTSKQSLYLHTPSILAFTFKQWKRSHMNTLFKNMIALEQCSADTRKYITSFTIFMDYLISTSEDVQLLEQKEILLNLVGTNDAAVSLFNGLGENINYDPY